jgi:hypothetical protein
MEAHNSHRGADADCEKTALDVAAPEQAQVQPLLEATAVSTELEEQVSIPVDLVPEEPVLLEPQVVAALQPFLAYVLPGFAETVYAQVQTEPQ